MQSFLDGVVVSAYKQTSLKIEKNKFPVEEHLAGFKVPNNIQRYISEMYPHLVKCLYMKRIYDPELQKELLSEFTIFLLEKSSKGAPRFKMYNPVKYPDIPYYKWFLFQLGWVLRKHTVAQAKRWANEKGTLSLSGDTKTVCDPETKIAGIVSLELIPNTDIPVPDLVILNQIPSFLQEYKKTLSPVKEKSAFVQNIDVLYSSMLAGETSKQNAKKLGVTVTTVYTWRERLRNLLAGYLQLQPSM